MRLMWAEVLLIFSASLLSAAEQPPDKPLTEEEKKTAAEELKKKIPPLKYDAWCVFSELSGRLPRHENPESTHSRINSIDLEGYGRRGKWAHVVLDLKNTTELKNKTSIEGFASIAFNQVQPGGSVESVPYSTRYRQPFKVGPESENQYHFSILCPDYGWNNNVEVRIETSSGLNYSRAFTLKDLDQDRDELIVVVSDTPGAFQYLGPARNRANADLTAEELRRPAGRQVAAVAPSELPERWQDLALASLIIIDGPPAEALSVEQWDALKTYARSGGRILIMAGRDPARLKGAAEELAGISVRGMSELPGIDQFDPPYPLKKRGPEEPQWKLPIVEVVATSANVVKRNSKTQLVEYSARGYGSGLVAFTAYSLSDRFLQDWPGRTVIPLGLLNKEKNLFSVQAESDSEDESGANSSAGFFQNSIKSLDNRSLAALRTTLDNSFENDTPVVMQAPSTVLQFLLLYLGCVVPLNFLLFTLLRRREAAWLATPLLALGFTIGAYYTGYSGQTGVTTVNEVTVLEAGPGQGAAVGRTFMGIYAPRRDEYKLAFPPQKEARGVNYDVKAAPGHLVNQSLFEQRGIDFPIMNVLDTGARLDVERILIQQRSTRRFEIQHRALVGGGVDLREPASENIGGATPGLVVTNNTGMPLVSALYFKNDRFVLLKPGARFEAGETIDTSSAPLQWRDGREQAFDVLARALPERGKHVQNRTKALTDFMNAHSRQYSAGVFLAWIDAPLLPVVAAPVGANEFATPHIEGITLLVVPVPVSNRGSRFAKAAFIPPRVEFTNFYNPEVPASGDWKPLKGKVPFDATFINSRGEQVRCVYLRLTFEDSFLRAYYLEKQTRLTVTYGGVNSQASLQALQKAEPSAAVRNDSSGNALGDFTLAEKLHLKKTQTANEAKYQFTTDGFFKYLKEDTLVVRLSLESGATASDLSTLKLTDFKVEPIEPAPDSKEGP